MYATGHKSYALLLIGPSHQPKDSNRQRLALCHLPWVREFSTPILKCPWDRT